MIGEDVAFAGVAGQVDLVRRGEVSARELVELALGRIERLDPELNAFCAAYPERALREAAAAAADAREREIEMRARDVPVILGHMFRAIHDLVDGVERPERLERRTRAFARPGGLVPDRMSDRLLAAEATMVKRIGALFDAHDVLLTPVMSEPAVAAGIMEGRGATATYQWESGWVPFTILWNITGQPAASVPAGQSREGLPPGGATRRTTPRRENRTFVGRPARGRTPVERHSAPHILSRSSSTSASLRQSARTTIGGRSADCSSLGTALRRTVRW